MTMSLPPSMDKGGEVCLLLSAVQGLFMLVGDGSLSGGSSFRFETNRTQDCAKNPIVIATSVEVDEGKSGLSLRGWHLINRDGGVEAFQPQIVGSESLNTAMWRIKLD